LSPLRRLSCALLRSSGGAAESPPDAVAVADASALTRPDISSADGSTVDASRADGGTADASTRDAAALDASAPRPVIQFALQQECRAGGLTFTVLPTSPFPGVAGYRFMWVRTMGTAAFVVRDNEVTAMNDATGDAIHFDVTVQRDGHADTVLRDVWADPCNRDGNPTLCPENLRVRHTNRERYRVGDAFEALVVGAPQGARWYRTDGLADVVQSDDGRTLRARVAALPVLALAEPNRQANGAGPVLCHGWSARYFVEADDVPADSGLDAAVDVPRVDVPRVDVPRVDAPRVDVPVDVPATPTPTVDRIQVQIHQECREGGVKVTVVPTSPFRGADGYAFAWTRTAGAATFRAAGNSVVADNAQTPSFAGYPMHFDVRVSYPGYPDRVVADVWSNPCNHDDNPTSCPENTRDLVTNQESYRAGDTFDARLTGTAQTLATPWYVLDGIADATFSEEGRHLVGRVAALPIHVHAQPNSTVGMAVCHGWTERWFYAP
jgi:hypothetical protein